MASFREASIAAEPHAAADGAILRPTRLWPIQPAANNKDSSIEVSPDPCSGQSIGANATRRHRPTNPVRHYLRTWRLRKGLGASKGCRGLAGRPGRCSYRAPVLARSARPTRRRGPSVAGCRRPRSPMLRHWATVSSRAGGALVSRRGVIPLIIARPYANVRCCGARAGTGSARCRWPGAHHGREGNDPGRSEALLRYELTRGRPTPCSTSTPRPHATRCPSHG